MKEDRSYSVGRVSTTSQHICFVALNSNSLLPPIAENQDDVNVHDFDKCTAALYIKHTPCLYSYIQEIIKVPSSKNKIMNTYSDKRHSEVSAEYLSCKWGIGL